MNQQQLAKLVGISQQHLSKIERDLMPASRDVKARLAAILGVSESDLFSDDSQKVAS